MYIIAETSSKLTMNLPKTKPLTIVIKSVHDLALKKNLRTFLFIRELILKNLILLAILSHPLRITYCFLGQIS